MHKYTLSACLLAALLLPATAWAMPGNVTGVEAQAVGTGVRVTWDPAEGSVAKYRVFWSHESILENDALFDDVVETEGPDTSLTLTGLPAVGDIYVTVLAVDPNGEESELFEEEAHAVRTPTASAETPAQETGERGGPSSVQRALKAEVLSATGVLVRFTLPVLLDAQTARMAFTIVDGANQELAVYRVKTDGPTVELHTLPQARQRAYRLKIAAGVRGMLEESGDVAPLASDQTDLLFIGSGDGVTGTTAVGAGTDDVRNVTVAAQPDGNNSYTVAISWAAPAATAPAGYRVMQTRDGGRTYGGAQMLRPEVTSIRIARAASGELGVLLQAVGQDGSVSRGILQRVILPATTGAPRASVMPTAPTTGSVVPRNGRLAQTGAGSAALLAMAGACAGVQTVRRRRRAA